MNLAARLQEIAAWQRDADWAQAERVLKELLARYPSDADLHRSMALQASSTGRHPLALRHLTTAFELAPDSMELGFQLGCLQAHNGSNLQALAHFQNAVAHWPERSDAWYFLGITLNRLHRDAEALAALRRAYALAPENARILKALADLEFKIGYPSDSLPLWMALERIQPQNLDNCLKRGETLSRLGFHDQAAAYYRDALDSMPGAGDLWMALGQAEEDLANSEAATQAYQQALGLRPEWAFPLSALLGLQRGKASEELMEQATRLQRSPSLTDAERALIGYALGKAQDARGEYESAMASWDDANAARRRTIGPPDLSRLFRDVDKTVEIFDRNFYQRQPILGSEDPRPVFIVGMPRSGTTLTEQIIASHPQAFGCGELPDIALIVRSLPVLLQSPLRWPDIADALANDGMQAAITRYLEAATRHAPENALRLVDKSPLNFFHLPLIALMFPHARVVWCRRDPRDVAVSIYAENFSLEEKMATDLALIGHYINVQDQLMRHWQATLPLPILELNYEQLVNDLETQARRLIDFTNLPWDPRCLQFYNSDRGVQTPSRWQVKQPAHTRSVGRWKHYQSHLQPLLKVLHASNFKDISQP